MNENDRGNYWLRARSARIGRRSLLRGAGAAGAGLAAMAVAGCGDDDDSGGGASSPAATAASGGSGASGGSASPASSPAAAATQITPKGQLNIAWHDPGVLQFWNPLFYISGWQVVYRDAVADSLIGFQPDGQKYKLKPKGANSWEKSPDGLTVTFKLNPKATFNDGSAMTSADVKFSYEACKLDAWRHARKPEIAGAIQTVETPDAQTAVVKLAKPYPLLVNYNYQLPIISKAAFDKLGLDGFENAPVVGGPFKFVSGVKAEKVMLTAVNNHYRKVPYFKDLQITVVKEEGTRVAQFQTGEVDMCPISPAFKKQAASVDGGKVIAMGDVPNYLAIMDPLTAPNSPAGKDKRVRQAISMAVNRKDIVAKLLEGEAKIQGSIATSVIPGYLDIPADNYDLTEAKKLLEAAGVGGGFSIDYWTSAPVPEYVNVMVADWKKIGIDVQLKIEDGTAAVTRIYGKKTPGMYMQSAGFDYTDGAMYTLFFHSTGTFSYHNYPDLDAALDKVQYGADDAQRIAAFGDVQRKVADEHVYTMLWSLNSLRAISKKVKKWDPVPGNGWFVNLEEAQS